MQNGPGTPTKIGQAAVVQTQAPSQSQIPLTENNPRRQQPGIL
jgi:hypothetical protein